MSKQVYRAVIPVNDSWHTLDLSGPIIHVATRGEDYVELWYIDDPSAVAELRTFRVFGTGQRIPPAAAEYVGTAITPTSVFVWHVFEHERSATT